MWCDEARWRGVLAGLDDPTRWTAGSRAAWDAARTAWERVRPELLAHAARFDDCGPGPDGPLPERAAWAARRAAGRFAEWRAAVECAVARAASAARALDAARARGAADAVRAALAELAAAGRHLKDVFSGRAHFNPAAAE